MSKALWVALPIALFFAATLALAVAKRPPSRLALNVTSSLLLLAYVAVTAGLGVFWVANQQLPAFDWHYLFGYGTVALLAVHLAFNVRVVLSFLRRRTKPGVTRGADATRAADETKAAGATRAGAPHARSRPPLAWIAIALAGMLLAFALGVRHGHVELHVGSGQASTSPAWAAVEEYHALSSHSLLGVLRRAPSVDWGDAPPPKRYAAAPRTPLPPPAPLAQPRSVSEAMRGPSAPRTEPLDLAALASILHHTSGVTHVRGGLELRAAPSSGALFPAEVYVLVRSGASFPAGLYHFDPLGPALSRIADELPPAALGVEPVSFDDAQAVVIVTAVLRRTGQKYRDRAYRYAAADIGHLLENVVVAASEYGLFATPLPAFDDALSARALGIDGIEEATLAILPLSPRRSTPAPRPHAYMPVDISSNRALGVTSTVHDATSLRLLPPRAADELPAAGPAAALPPPSPAPGTTFATIAARESRRTYAPAPLPLADLGALLANATAVPPALSSAISLHVVANRVGGLSPGAHVLTGSPPALVPVRPGDLSKEAFEAALSQDVIGGAAAVLVLAIDRERARAEGPRGYRHAFLELGMLGERIVLEATARGLPVCPVGAFYDDDAAALLGVDPKRTWVAHFIGLGLGPR